MPTDNDDPTRVLDGWVPGGGRGNPNEDPTRILDGWNPAAAAAPRVDPSLPVIEAWQPGVQGALPAPEDTALPQDLNLHVNTRYSKFDTSDVTDVDAVWPPPTSLASLWRPVKSLASINIWAASVKPMVMNRG
jgi:hypothetical protein